MDTKLKIQRAAQLRKEGKAKESLQSFRLLSQQFPEEIIPWLAISSMSHNFQEREAAIDKALRLDPDNKTALQLQAKLEKIQNQQVQSAKPVKSQLVEMQPGVPPSVSKETLPLDPITVQLHQAVTLRQNGEQEKALSIFQNIVQQIPEQQTAWWGIYTIAQTHAQKQDALIQLLRLAPDNQQIRSAYFSHIPVMPTSIQERSDSNLSSEPKSPIGLIIFTWLLLAVGFAPVAGIDEEIVIIVGIISFFSVIGSILLIRHENRTANINGWIILIIWILLAGIGFMIGFGSAFM